MPPSKKITINAPKNGGCGKRRLWGGEDKAFALSGEGRTDIAADGFIIECLQFGVKKMLAYLMRYGRRRGGEQATQKQKQSQQETHNQSKFYQTSEKHRWIYAVA